MHYVNKLKPVNKAWVGLLFIGNGIVALFAGISGLIAPYICLLVFALLCGYRHGRIEIHLAGPGGCWLQFQVG